LESKDEEFRKFNLSLRYADRKAHSSLIHKVRPSPFFGGLLTVENFTNTLKVFTLKGELQEKFKGTYSNKGFVLSVALNEASDLVSTLSDFS